jgi:hypothetical protein
MTVPQRLTVSICLPLSRILGGNYEENLFETRAGQKRQALAGYGGRQWRRLRVYHITVGSSGCLVPLGRGAGFQSRKLEMGNMKKTYSKPVLVKKGKLSQITANGASNPR